MILHFPFLSSVSIKPSAISVSVSVFLWIHSWLVMYLIGVDSRHRRCIQIWTFPWVLEEDLPDFFNFTLVTKPVGTAQTTGFDSLPRRLKGARRTLPACLQSCSTITEALTTARDAQQGSAMLSKNSLSKMDVEQVGSWARWEVEQVGSWARWEVEQGGNLSKLEIEQVGSWASGKLSKWELEQDGNLSNRKM